MQKELAERLVAIYNRNLDFEPEEDDTQVKVYNDYFGRYMPEKTTGIVTTDYADFFSNVLRNITPEDIPLLKTCPSFRTDSIAYRIILY